MQPRFKYSENNKRRNHSTARGWQIGVCIALGVLLTAIWARGQESSSVQVTNPNTTTANRPPLSHIYMHFLLYQNHLDRAATERDNKGKDGSWLRDHFQNQLGFSPSQFATIRATGLRLESELKDIGSQAKAIVAADREAHIADPSLPRTPNSQLKDLTKQREALLQSEIDKLNQQLGPQDAAKLQDFLQNHFVTGPSVLPPGLQPHPVKQWQPKREKVQ